MESVPEDLGGIVFTPEERRILHGQQNTSILSRVYDVTIRWMISGVMFALNSALLPYMAGALERGEFLGKIMLGSQFLFVGLWYLLEMRMQGLVTYWNGVLKAIELLLRPRQPVYSGAEWEKRVAGVWFTTHKILSGMIVLMAGMLFAILGHFLYYTVAKGELPPQPTPHAIEKKLREVESLKSEIGQLKNRIEELERRKEMPRKAVPKPTPPKTSKGKKGERR